MGLAASAAQKVLITGAISDLEYQVQQLQRAKLDLSDRTSMVNQKALELAVPTEPSKSDFLTDVYASTSTANGNYRASMGPDGLELYKYEEKAASLKTEGAPVQAQLFEKAEVPQKQPNTITVSVPGEQSFNLYKSSVDGSYISAEAYGSLKNGNCPETFPDGKDKDGNDKTRPATNADKAQYQGSYTAAEFWKKDEHNPQEVEVTTGGALPTFEHEHTTFADGGVVTQAEAMDYDFTYLGMPYVNANADDLNNVLSGFSEAQINSLVNHSPAYYTSDAPNASRLSVDDFKQAGKVGQLSASGLYTKLDNEKIGNGTAYTFDEIKGQDFYQANQSSIDGLIARAKTYSATQNGGITPDMSNWRIVYENGSFNVVCLDPENGQAQGFGTTDASSGWVQQNVSDFNINDATGTGNITVTDNDGQKVSIGVTKSQVTDEAAYNNAKAKYNVDYAEYKKEQVKYNKELADLQNQDKKLDMQLADIEKKRSAWQKMLEGLEKVMEDNTEQNFSAFS